MQSARLRPAVWGAAAMILAGAATGSDPLTEDAAVKAVRQTLPPYLILPAADSSRLTAASREPSRAAANWARSSADSAGSRYSSLDQINSRNVQNLRPAWTYHAADGKGHLQVNPIVIDGVLYGPTPGGAIVALDAATGKERWRFKPEGRPAQRGLVYWPGSATLGPRVYFLTPRYLYALEAVTGKPAGFGTDGRVAIRETPLDGGIGTVAPAIYQDTLVAPHGSVVKGFRVDNGELLWTFNLNPLAGEFGAGSWSMRQGGVNCWGGMAMDEERGIAYVSTGSPHPNIIGVEHAGRNLFGNCVVALKARTGERLWHFQEIRHDIWDLDLPAPPNLVTVEHEGRKIDAVAQVTKLGNTLLLDRLTGQPLFPFRLRRAPESTLPGERTWPYQPDLELPQPFARQVFTREDITNISANARESVEKLVGKADFGWFAPFEEGKPTVYYGIHGGAEWTGAAFDPRTGWLYVTSNELPWIITPTRVRTRDWSAKTPGRTVYEARCGMCHGARRQGGGTAPALASLERRFNDAQLRKLIAEGRNAMPAIPMETGEYPPLLEFLFDRDLPPEPKDAQPRYSFLGFQRLLDSSGYPGCRPPWGTLNAIDLNTGKRVWQVPLGEYPELTKLGMPITGTENFGGAIVTAGGLVFAAGTRDQRIRAFDSRTGKQLWEHALPFGGYAPPATYEAGGRQYVVVAATGGGKLGPPLGDTYVGFALP